MHIIIGLDDISVMMDLVQRAQQKHHQAEGERLGIPTHLASDICLFREQKHWSQAKEDYLIGLAKDGKSFPYIMEDFEVK